jgi:glycosyltransferase involved in cell wall biosynthesis
MKIGINLIPLRPGRDGEVEAHVRGLLPHLAALDRQNDYLLVTGPENDATFRDAPRGWARVLYLGREHMPPAYCQAVPLGLERRSWLSPVKHLARRVIKRSQTRRAGGKLAELLRREGVGLWFCPLTYALPVETTAPIVTLVPDLQHEHHAGLFPEDELAERTVGYEYSCRAAAATLTTSRHTAAEVTRFYGVGPGRVCAVPPAPDPRLEGALPALARYAGDARIKYRVDGDFAFYPAHTLRHRNFEPLLRALQRVRRERPGLRLVVTGSREDLRQELKPLVRQHDLGGAVVPVAAPRWEDLVGLTAAARLVVFPALAEGFGQPLLAAMRLGTPVACAGGGSLTEVGGDAVVPFDPLSAEAIADAVLALVGDGTLRERLIAAARAHASGFNYAATAAATLAVFNKVRDGTLARPGLPPFRPLGPQRLLNDGRGRWFFRLPSLREVELRVVQSQPPRACGGQHLAVYLDGRQVLDSRLVPKHVCHFVVRPPAGADGDFHSLELVTTSPEAFDLEPLPVQVLSVVAVDSSRHELPLVA